MTTHRYRREIAELCVILCRCGLEKSEIIRLLAIDETRFTAWIRKHSELREAMQQPSISSQAEKALLKRALGFQINEESSEVLVDKKSGEILEVLKKRTITKDVPPDVRALLFYLQNRYPDRWDKSHGAGSDFHFEVSPDEAEL